MFGVGVGFGLSLSLEGDDNNIQMPNVVPEDNYVSVHQQCVDEDHTVEQGSITCTWNIPNEIPYNIEEADLAGWNVVCEVYGQYFPLGDSVVELWQTVNEQYIFLGKLKIEWAHTTDPGYFPWPNPGCSPDVWTGTFKMWDCGNAILPHSSYYPDLINPDCIILNEKLGLLPDPKFVDFIINTTWEGCDTFNVICNESGHIVQKGYIDCVINIPPEIAYNIEAEDLIGWTAHCEVMGQYEILGDSDVVLYQTVNGQRIYLGQLYIDWTHTTDPGYFPGSCSPDIWDGVFTPWWCDNPILPWSSYYPIVSDNCYIDGGLSGLLSDPKHVDFEITTHWEGCEPFDVILSQKNLFLNPQL